MAGRHEEHMDYSAYGISKTQTQVQRSLEASKQKIYTVFGNVINILEELENREQKKNGGKYLSKSKTDYYDHSCKEDETVDEVVQGQLIAMEAILKGCNPLIKDSMRKELENKTTEWINFRRKNRVPKDVVDTYAEMLLEVIVKGGTSHSKQFLSYKSKDSKFDKYDAQTIVDSNYRANQVEQEFQNDPNKKATPPAIRSGSADDAHFIHISGRNDKSLALSDQGHVLVFSNNRWKFLTQIKDLNAKQIHELQHDNDVLVLDECGRVFFSNRTLSKWEPTTPGKAITNIIVSKTTIAVDEENRVWGFSKERDQNWTPYEAFPYDKNIMDVAFTTLDIMAIDRNGRIICLDAKGNTWEPEITQPKDNHFSKIYCGSPYTEIWAVDNKGKVYTKAVREINKEQWELLEGLFVQHLACTYNHVMVLDKNHDIWIQEITFDKLKLGKCEKMGSFREIYSDISEDLK